jgi:hypothetical protein
LLVERGDKARQVWTAPVPGCPISDCFGFIHIARQGVFSPFGSAEHPKLRHDADVRPRQQQDVAFVQTDRRMFPCFAEIVAGE